MDECLFCDNTELTHEHIYADWLVQYFKKNVKPKRGAYKRTQKNSGIVIEEHHQGTIEEKWRLVCDTCNNGWMSAIENNAIPALMPLIEYGVDCDRRLISIEEQCAIAVWVQLRSIIFDALPHNQSPYYTRSERLAFANHPDVLAPFPNAYIWVAAFHGIPWGTSRTILNGAPLERNFDSKAHVATGTVHHLAFQLLISKGSRPLAPNFAGLKAAGWLDVARRVFPSTTDIDWPPLKYVGEESLKFFQTRFSPDTIQFRY